MAPQLIQAYVDTGKLKIVWRDFAWISQESRLAAQAARCAGKQGKFWELHDHLYRNQGPMPASRLKQFAFDIGLSTADFNACLDEGGDLAAIQQELANGRSQGITATPAFVLNGQRIVGAQDFNAFSRAIEAELAKQ